MTVTDVLENNTLNTGTSLEHILLPILVSTASSDWSLLSPFFAYLISVHGKYYIF